MRKFWMALGCCLLALAVVAQVPPQQIDKKIQEAWEKLPSDTVKYEDILEIQYKKIPFFEEKWVEEMAKKQGLNVNPQMVKAYAKQLLPLLAQKMAKYFQNIGTWKSERPIRWGSKKIPAGQYHLAAVVDLKSRRLLHLAIWRKVKKGKKFKKQVFYLKPSKRWRKRTPLRHLNIKILPHRKRKKQFALVVAYGFEVQRSRYVKVLK